MSNQGRMSGRVAFIPQQPHDCEHPPDGSHPTWTRWDCDCGERWIALPPGIGEFDPKTHWARWPHDKQQEAPAGRWPWKRRSHR